MIQKPPMLKKKFAMKLSPIIIRAHYIKAIDNLFVSNTFTNEGMKGLLVVILKQNSLMARQQNLL